VILLTVVVGLAGGCARQPRPLTTPMVPLPRPGVAALRTDLAGLFATPTLRRAVFGVKVMSLATGDTLYVLNPDTLLMPASNMKVVTAAAAGERLGWARTFETRLVSTGTIENGVLTGDLVIVGAGDPSLGGRPGQGVAVLDAWVSQLQAAGVTRITGRLIGDDNLLDDQGLGEGWAWDDLGAAYATPTSGLSFGENVVRLSIKPGDHVGAPAAVVGTPAGHGLTIVSTVTTGAQDSSADFDYRRLPGSDVLTISGHVPMGTEDVTRLVSVDNPTAFTAGVVKAGLIERGVAVEGEAIDIDTLPDPPDITGARVLSSWVSPTLAEIMKVLLKVSQNLYAETLLELVGRSDPTASDPATGSAATGRKVVRDTLLGWGVGNDGYIQADGSGLSRYNYLSADVLVRILRRMYEDPRHRAPFLDALPIAGVDGTLGSRMKGTRAAGNCRAKTGSIANVRALSGYVTSTDGEPLVFSMIANNFNVPQAEIDAVVDRAVARLADFRRH
jgi:D-alanyl-D-alanine carboxypeptidase/D-alanyl-D-alanine-endopeptidase (penicillin-binding protein 4)